MLSLNLDKTCFMSINSRTIINIYLNNRNIERVTFYKFLGVIIDDILNWKQHILFLKSKLKKIIWITNIILYIILVDYLLIIFYYKINEITYISICEFMFKVYNDIYPYITNAFLFLMSLSHNTRSLNNFSIINFKKELCRRTLIYVGPIT